MPRFGIWLLMLLLALMGGAVAAQDDGAEPIERATVTAETADDESGPATEESADSESAEAPEPVGRIEAAEPAAPTDGPTPEPAATGAPLVVYILVGGVLVAAGIFLMRRSAVKAS